MEGGNEKGWTVPQFGGWNEKTGGAPDYSMVFSRARANRKQQKTSDVVKKSSVANEEENIRHQQDQRPNNDCSTKRRKLLSYLCLIPNAH
ncbi:RIN4 pathogenic type III effector avirulence factor Avr cleavage site domain-containing protein [Dioscorea alata]|uniref:RIN4 pathogenic type III effector avirulence factor Avr cleavage site domain-containing protein n=1 Tax=Dioscorea alata TaxID=55571 RepID=A0ACB7V1U2_DIOAL|nr:RIN4 pathogenic type III effector avirulence factor Avr cleavage site domain-containing protein [Dioscorea alata]